MPKVTLLDDADGVRDLNSHLVSAFQSAHLNLLLGSGASSESINVAGSIEKQIAALYKDGNIESAMQKKCEFLSSILSPTNDLLRQVENVGNRVTIQFYSRLLAILEGILLKRNNTLLPRQLNLFTTNYDLYLESASAGLTNAILNDGFNRITSLDHRYRFSHMHFFDMRFKRGDLHEYKVELPSINLIKLHGSLSWQTDQDHILFRAETFPELSNVADSRAIDEFINQFSIVFPEESKFEITVLNRNYYSLLRLFANALDRENCLLLVFGFSFADKHILDIVLNALSNPTLKLIIFAYRAEDVPCMREKFINHSNVEIVSPKPNHFLDFETFNLLLNVLNTSEPEVKLD